MINKRDVTEYECSNWGNQYPVCEPTSKDTWYQGSDYKFIWNYNNPYYIINTPVENNSLDFHLYHLENFAYKHIREWNNLPLLTGSLEVNVNNTWFPKPAPENKNETWQMFGWFLPAGSNATQMLTATDSTYPRPFNWSVVQTYDPNYATENPDGASNSDTKGSSDSSNDGSGLPGWAIAVIVIACVAFVAAICAIAAVFYLRRRQKQSRQPMTMTEAAAIAAARQQQHQQQSSPPGGNPPMTMVGGGTTKSDGMSVYSNTPMMGAAGSHSRDSATSTDGGSSTRQRASPPADTFRNLMYSEWKSRIPTSEQEEEEEEMRRRRLGEALLQRELEEEGAAVKHTDRRPMTVAPPEALESKAVVLERQDDNHPSPPQ